MAGDSETGRRRAPLSSRSAIVGVIGELLITAGVLVFLYLGWQLWLNDLVVGGQQESSAQELSEGWERGRDVAPATPDRADPGKPKVATAPENTVRFANLIVPRFGADYRRPISEGVGTADSLRVGVGHYPGTQMPGDVGNVALAGHRTTWGAPFAQIAELQVGDSIYIETEDGWYRYVFRSLEYVLPTQVAVIDAVPQSSNANPDDRILTMTSCNPKFSAAERLIAYSLYDTWYPRAEGPPAEIAQLVQDSGGN